MPARVRVLLCCLLIVLPARGGAVRAAESDAGLVADEKLLRGAGVATDGPGLLAFLRARSPAATEPARLAAAIRRLGDDSFDVREQTSRDLITAGRPAVPLLRRALSDPDAEIARRADRCLLAIDQRSELTLTAAAARLLAARRPPAATGVLLDCLPTAGDDVVEEAIVQALAAVGVRDGKADPALSAALTDRMPARRAAAAFVLGRGSAEQRRSVAPLLADPDARVRFQAAAALLRAGDARGVPPLLALLGEGPPDLAWQADDLLVRVAGARAPVPPAATEAVFRRKWHAVWDRWWKEQAAGMLDLARIDWDAPLGLTVICELDGSGNGNRGRVWECGPDGKPRWEIDSVLGPIDVQLLPGGRLLVAEHGRGARRVTERDRQGNILWERRLERQPVCCQRLANGNTFIATYNQLLETDRDDKTVFSFRPTVDIWSARKVADDHVLCVFGGLNMAELDADGKVVRSLPFEQPAGWAGVEPAADGHYLVAQFDQDLVAELNPGGKVLWQGTVTTPGCATRLGNGHTLSASIDGHQVVELDSSGNVVWKQATQGRPFRARRR
jgi:HEAT repeat protein